MEPTRLWYVYVIRSDASNRYYRGITTDPVRRLRQHNEGKGAKYTRGRGPWHLFALRFVGHTLSDALLYEAYLRSLRKSDFLEWCSEHRYKDENLMNHEVMFSSKNMEWETPMTFVRQCEQLIGKQFTLDACAKNKKVARAPSFWSPADNALIQPWAGVVWMNPPYGRTIKRWAVKALSESREHGSTVACLLPARTDTRFFHEVCVHGDVYLIKGRIVFEIDGKPLLSKHGKIMPATFPSMVVVFSPRKGRRVIKPWSVGALEVE